ncbi:MAG: FemAB family protein, partial [Chloroflexi bacterium]|nr:FemAB family protein [Chloroflexota bacterium]
MNLPFLDWNARITTLPDSHLLQTAEWGRFKALYGWEVLPQLWLASGERYDTGNEPLSEEVRAAALVLQRTTAFGWLPFNLRLLYVPKGPLLDWSDLPVRRKVLADLKQLAHQQRAIFIKIDPDVRLGIGVPGGPDELPDPTGQAVEEDLQASGWRYSPEQVQFRNTVLIDLVHPEEELLAVMKQKTRYNIRLAAKKGVTVRPGEVADLETLYQMYAETSIRDGFVIRDRAYYLQLWNSFISAGMAKPLVAEWGGQPVAGLVLFHFAG